MKRRLIWIMGTLVIIAVSLLLTGSTPANPPLVPGNDLLATNPPPAEITALLRSACYDCHSHETKWPWYNRIGPLSWWLASHVKEGREELNFSDWPHDDPRRAARKWRRIAEEVSYGNMPLPSYTWAHAEARLTARQREQLTQWAEQEARRLRPAAEEPE